MTALEIQRTRGTMNQTPDGHARETATLAYHADPALRARVLAATAEHARLDEVVQGTYDDGNGRGCHVGCLCRDFGLRSDDHAGLAAALGWPEALLMLTDRIHEGLSPTEARVWPSRVNEAVPLGADLALVTSRFMLALLTDPKRGVVSYVHGPSHSQQREAVEAVAVLLRRYVAGGAVTDDEWAAAVARAGWAARTAGWTARAAGWAAQAAGWAAWAARAAGWAAETAGWAAETAARTAQAKGWATETAEAAEAAAAAMWAWQAQTLIEILKTANRLEKDPSGRE